MFVYHFILSPTLQGQVCIFLFSVQVFPSSSAGKESTCKAGKPGSIPGSGRPSGEGNGYSLQYSGLENFHGLYNPWGYKELDMTEWLSLSYHKHGISLYLASSSLIHFVIFCSKFFKKRFPSALKDLGKLTFMNWL